MSVHTFTAFFPFCGLGAGARGFVRTFTQLGQDRARFLNLGGVDFDAEACADFEYLTGAPALQADLHHLRTDELLRWLERKHGRKAARRRPDCVFLSPPCLPGDGPVVTAQGVRRIDSIRAGDAVLTHLGRYRFVEEVGSRLYDGDLHAVRLNGTVDHQRYTAEHPIWRRRLGKNGLREPEFVPASELRVGDRVGFPVEAERRGTARAFVQDFGDPTLIVKGGKATGRYAKPKHAAKVDRIVDLRPLAESPDLWFLFGAYLGDGYRRVSRHEVAFCVGPSDGSCAEQVREALRRLGFEPYEDVSAGTSNIKLRVSSVHLCRILGAFGDGCELKDIPPELMGLERALVEALIAGYRATDGSEQPRRQYGRQEFQARWRITSVSLSLLRSVQRLLLRLGAFGCINMTWRGGPQTIMDREVITRPRWTIVVRQDPKKRTVYEFDRGAVWVRVREIKREPVKGLRVWNLSVAEDDTFCSPLIATHNCKGFSRLLGTAASQTPKYQELNRLVYEGLFLMMETWAPQRPPLVVIENVPGIVQRGAELLDRVYRMLGNYGYVFHHATHDCGEVGGLAQHRKRFLLVARDPRQVGAYVYQPPKKRVKGCGEVLVELPLPGDEGAGGLLHRLPDVEWITTVRLAHIPPGGDWRDLPRKLGPAAENPGRHHSKFRVEAAQAPAHAVTGSTKPADGAPSYADPRGAAVLADVQEPAENEEIAAEYRRRFGDLALGHEPRRGTMGVMDPEEPAPTVRGRADVRTGTAAIADAGSILAVTHRDGRHTSQYRMGEWQEPANTVTGCTDVQEGAQLVAEPLEAARKAWEQDGVKLPGLDAAWFKGKYKIDGWDGPTRTVIGGPGNGAEYVAQPLQLGATAQNAGAFAGRPGLMGVQDWGEPSPAVIGRASVSGGHATAAVAEPFGNVMRVLREDEPSGTVTHSPSPTSGAPAVADSGFRGKLGVADWQEPAATVKGESYPTNGGGAVAEPIQGARFHGSLGVNTWDGPTGVVAGATHPTNGVFSVAEPLITGPNIGDPTRGGAFGVLDWGDPARTVTGNVAAASSNSPGSVADPRLFSPLAPGQEHRAIMGRYRVIDWRQPSPGVTGPGTNSVYGVADERALALNCSPRAGMYGVLSWQQAAATITGTARVDNGPFAVADPRPGEPGWRPPKGVIVVIVSQWNCWHRPLTTLELAVLQSMPWKVNGRPLELAGNSVARKRERIGNAVPVHAASAVARSVLKALLASALGCWHLSGGPGEEIWVRSDGRPEDEFPDLDPPTYEALPG